MKNFAENTCNFSDAIISYVYDEIGEAERLDLEGHLPDCSSCTDEFAAVSNARLSVYEMRRDVFDAIPTPVFEIPYETAVTAGLAGRLRSLLGGLAMPIPLGAAAILLVGAMVFISMRSTTSDDVIADIVPISPPASTDSAPAVPGPAAIQPKAMNEEPKPERKTDNFDVKPDLAQRPVRSQRASSKPLHRRPAAAQTARRTDGSQPAKAPTLSNYTESDDRSLRLTDLFSDEIGSTRR